ncbi:hypothetical protein [Synechococcus sp. MIT S9509]|nr:hypothetical protein [Synechococcus sp. MIT S9509]
MTAHLGAKAAASVEWQVQRELKPAALGQRFNLPKHSTPRLADNIATT